MKCHISIVENLIKDAEECGLRLNEEWRKIIFVSSLRKCSNFQSFVGSVDIAKSSWSNLTSRAKEMTYADEKTVYQVSQESTCLRCGRKGDKKRFWERKGSNKALCFECGGKGHFSRDHRNPHRFSQQIKDKEDVARQDIKGVKRRRANLAMKEEEDDYESNSEPDQDENPKFYQANRLDREQIENLGSHGISMYADSGAGITIVNNKEFLSRYSPCRNQFIVIGDGKRIQATGQGELLLHLDNGTIRTDALYVPEIKVQLLSISQLAKQGTVTTFDSNGIVFYRNETAIGKGRIQGEDYIVDGKVSVPQEAHPVLTASTIETTTPIGEETSRIGNSYWKWHARLGHPGKKKLKQLMDTGAIDQAEIPVNSCETCIQANLQRKPHQSVTNEDTQNGAVFVDLWGPARVQGGSDKYFLVILHSDTRKLFLHTIASKDMAASLIIQTVRYIDRQYGAVKRIHSDCGGEFMNNVLKHYCNQNGIKQTFTEGHDPKQNGRAERVIQTIVKIMRALLLQSRLPTRFWNLSAKTAAFLYNRLPHYSTGSIPNELFYKRKVDTSFLRSWGCIAYVFNKDSLPNTPNNTDLEVKKLINRGIESKFVGYDERKGTYKFLSINGKLLESKHAIFFEEKFTWSKESPISETDVFQPGHYILEGIDNSQHQEDPEPQTIMSIENLVNHIDTTSLVEPTTYSEAMTAKDSENWKHAINLEIAALKDNQTWTLVPPISNVKPIDSKWVFKYKLNENGVVDRHKARLVAKGYTQREGIDYDETFTPTTKYMIVKMLLAYAINNNFWVSALDVENAYLNAKVDKEIYMHQPEGAVDQKHPNNICKLEKSLYGLKQAAKLWHDHLSAILCSNQLIQDINEPTLFHNQERTIVINTFVDDMLALWKDARAWEDLAQGLRKSLRIKVANNPSLFLGMTLKWTNDGVHISHENQIGAFLTKHGMGECKGLPTPMEGYASADSNPDNTTMADVRRYQQCVGGLLYFSQTSHPEITCAVNYYCKFSLGPQTCHWNGLKRIMQYLSKTQTVGINIRKSSTTTPLIGYSDSDFASDPIHRKSRIGYVFTMYGTPISQKSTCASLPALSTTEAEYSALTEAAKEALYLRKLIHSLGIDQQTIPLCTDNQGSIKIATHPTQHQRTKHYDTKMHFIRFYLRKKEISVQYIPGTDNPADLFTKPLQRIKIETHCKTLQIQPRE
jgi:histone deacetylase 1/2